MCKKLIPILNHLQTDHQTLKMLHQHSCGHYTLNPVVYEALLLTALFWLVEWSASLGGAGVILTK